MTDVRRAEYEAYLLSDQWKARRVARLARDGGKCAACGGRERLHVHHRTYRHFKHEPLEDLITLCEKCHALVHEAHRGQSGLTLDAVTQAFIGKTRKASRRAAAIAGRERKKPEKKAKGPSRRTKRKLAAISPLGRHGDPKGGPFVRVLTLGKGWHLEPNPAFSGGTLPRAAKVKEGPRWEWNTPPPGAGG